MEKFFSTNCITFACAGGVPSLYKERFDDTVEYGVVIVTLKAELDEIPGRFRRLFWPQLDV